MSYDDYVRQLQQVNEAIKTSTDDKKDDLLSLKNSIEELLALTSENGEDSVELESNIDDEYAQFMAEINDEHSRKPTRSNEDISENDKSGSLEGKKCRAPHVNKWGSKGYHNAMICSILNSNEVSDQIQVRILFTNPTHEEMLPCPYYFDTDCKFTEDRCKYSHGEVLLLSDLQDYVEPNFESLRIGSEILAKKDNNLWARAKIKRILNNTCMVKFESTKKEVELPFEKILPLENDEDSPSGDSSEEELQISQDTINLSLMNAPPSGQLGEWEKFTRGIGSKLMQKMGYVVGTGLGKKSDGRLDPVTAVILPTGKSLDHCMNLREKSGGDKDLFTADKQMKRRQKRQEIRNQRAYERELSKKDVFQFLNDTLTTTSDDVPSCSKPQHKTAIKKESCRSLNVAGLKIDGNIRKIERDVFILKESLARHKDINSQMHKNLQQKLRTTLEELSILKNQAENIKNEQNFRKDKRKLTIF